MWGLGAVGLATIMGAKAVGARQIVAIDIAPEKFEKGILYLFLFDLCILYSIAKLLGATDFESPHIDRGGKPFQAYLVEKYNGGFDFTFECVGNVNTMVFFLLLKRT